MKEENEEPREPTEEEIILIDFLENLFKSFRRVSTLEEADISITPKFILQQVLDFYPGAPFSIPHIFKFLVDNDFKYETVPGLGTVWLISYKDVI